MRSRLSCGFALAVDIGADPRQRAPQKIGALATSLAFRQQGRGHPAVRLARPRTPGRQPSALLGENSQPVAPQVIGGDRQKIGGQAAMAISVTGSTSALKSYPKAEPSLPLRAAQRTWSRRSAPLRDHRICWDLFMRRLTRKLAVPSVIEVPTRRPARWRSA